MVYLLLFLDCCPARYKISLIEDEVKNKCPKLVKSNLIIVEDKKQF
jgi:hypothetical protein